MLQLEVLICGRGLMLKRFGTMDEALSAIDRIHISAHKTEQTGVDPM
jgi:hypothetical protein